MAPRPARPDWTHFELVPLWIGITEHHLPLLSLTSVFFHFSLFSLFSLAGLPGPDLPSHRLRLGTLGMLARVLVLVRMLALDPPYPHRGETPLTPPNRRPRLLPRAFRRVVQLHVPCAPERSLLLEEHRDALVYPDIVRPAEERDVARRVREGVFALQGGAEVIPSRRVDVWVAEGQRGWSIMQRAREGKGGEGQVMNTDHGTRDSEPGTGNRGREGQEGRTRQQGRRGNGDTRKGRETLGGSGRHGRRG